MLLLKSLLALLLPATAAFLVPWWVAGPTRERLFGPWSAGQLLLLVPFAAGLAIVASCVRDFAVVGRGTLAPMDPPKRLVVVGLYRYVRNPMYLGVALLLLSEAAFLGSWRVLAWFGAWALIVNGFILFHEEPHLTRAFGQDYVRYCAAVRRWLPGWPYRPDAPTRP